MRTPTARDLEEQMREKSTKELKDLIDWYDQRDWELQRRAQQK